MRQTKKGTSIIEIVIAASLISMAVIAALSLANQSQKQNSYAKNLSEATKYATQGADWIRNEKNTLGWSTINTLSDGTYCLNDFPLDMTAIQSGSCDSASHVDSTIFTREIEMVKSVDTINITVIVSWIEQVKRQATIELELSSWH